jgi:hypothetical protein
VRLNFNLYIKNHVMARASKGYSLKKGSLRWHLNELLGCACIFFAEHLLTIYKEEICAGENNGIVGSTI